MLTPNRLNISVASFPSADATCILSCALDTAFANLANATVLTSVATPI